MAIAQNESVAFTLKPQTLSATTTGTIVDLKDYDNKMLLFAVEGGKTNTSTNKWTVTVEAGDVSTLSDAAAVDDSEMYGSFVFDGSDPAYSTLTITSAATATKTVTIGTRAYTFVDSLTSPAVADEVTVGANAAAAAANLTAAINGAAGAGSTYSTGTTANTQVTAVQGTGGDTNKVTITAITAGAAGNAIATTTNDTACAWTSTVMAGGVSPVTVPFESNGSVVIDEVTPSSGGIAEINYLGNKRYIRAKFTKAASAVNTIVAVSVVRGGAKYLPV